jgi:hypothetical protein
MDMGLDFGNVEDDYHQLIFYFTCPSCGCAGSQYYKFVSADCDDRTSEEFENGIDPEEEVYRD